MKQRFSSLDVKVIAHELSNTLVTLRVSNIYDLSTKIFLVKFQKPEQKEQIIIDSGFRCHLTEFARATAAAPSPFVSRLRKALKTRRVTSVSQVGTDRVIEFQFSDGLYRLYLEFYAGGNIILTDKDLNILTLLRVVPQGQGEDEQRVGLKYNLENRQNYGGIPDLTRERLQEALQKAADKGDAQPSVGKKSKKGPDALRKALAVSITEYPPMLVDHAMKITEFDSTLKPADVAQNEALLEHLMKSLEEAQRVIKEITSSEVAKGYIIAKKKDNHEEVSQEDTRKGLLYEDFHPFRPKQFENDDGSTFLEFDGFNKTVDEFFSSIEGQRLSSRLEERELNAQKKIQAARQDQQKRLGGLREVQELNERKASALQANHERVQETMDAVNGLIAQGKDWVEIGKLIELEQKRHNPVADLIKLPLKLEQNTITILLDEEDFESDDDSAIETDVESDSEDEVEKKEVKTKAADKRLVIDIDLGLSPWANAREYFDQRRNAVEKQQKTLQSSTKALKSQEAKISQDLKRGLKQEKAVLRPLRRQMWFEKFIWFISSDGYLVLAGKDAQQNEILYKKYLKKGDIYVHADLQGAATVVIRNNIKTPDAPIPPSTLSQAGTLAVACSSAWDSKAGMSAWWVKADQVSKSAPTGEFLPTGSFMIKGQKNFLPPAVLLLGFGILFQVSEESKSRHQKHRLNYEGTDDTTTAAETQVHQPMSVDDEDDVQDASASVDGNEQNETNEEDGSDDDLEADAPDSSNLPQAQPEIQNEKEDVVTQTESLQDLTLEDKAETQADTEKAEDDNEDASESEPESLAPTATTGTQTPSSKGPGQLKRGKRTKAKKAALKYKDQDESDRLAAQALLGAHAAQNKTLTAAAEKAAKEKEQAFQKERRRAQHLRAQQETAEHEEKRKALFEAGVADEDVLDPEEEEKQSLLLDTLVGTPFKGDEILEAITVCAPWSAMGKYKYKVKLQPGSVKKGKAVKEILSKWIAAADGDKGKGKVIDEKAFDPERMWPREVELIRGLRPEEVTNTVPVSKVRLVMAGGSAGAEKGKGGSGKAGRGGKGGGKKR